MKKEVYLIMTKEQQEEIKKKLKESEKRIKEQLEIKNQDISPPNNKPKSINNK